MQKLKISEENKIFNLKVRNVGHMQMMKLNNLFKKVQYSVAVVYVIIAHILKQIYFKRNMKVYVFNSNSHIKHICPKITCEIKKIKHVNDIKKYRKNISSRNFIRFSILLGHDCKGYFATKDDELLSLCWIANLKKYCPFPHNKYLLEASNDALSIPYAHTFEKYRGNRIFPYILSYIVTENSEDVPIYACINISNVPSQKAFERAGFKFAYILKYLKLFGIEIYVKKEYVKDEKRIK